MKNLKMLMIKKEYIFLYNKVYLIIQKILILAFEQTILHYKVLSFKAKPVCEQKTDQKNSSYRSLPVCDSAMGYIIFSYLGFCLWMALVQIFG